MLILRSWHKIFCYLLLLLLFKTEHLNRTNVSAGQTYQHYFTQAELDKLGACSEILTTSASTICECPTNVVSSKIPTTQTKAEETTLTTNTPTTASRTEKLTTALITEPITLALFSAVTTEAATSQGTTEGTTSAPSTAATMEAATSRGATEGTTSASYSVNTTSPTTASRTEKLTTALITEPITPARFSVVTTEAGTSQRTTEGTTCPSGWRQSVYISENCFGVFVKRKIWFEAELFCQAAAPGAHLTSVQNAFEAAYLNAIVIDTSTISACDQLWIGANDFDQNGQFVWTNGNSFQYAKWNPGISIETCKHRQFTELNNRAGQPDLKNRCVSSQARTTGDWVTENCGTENCFICEQQKDQSSTTNKQTATQTPASFTAATTEAGTSQGTTEGITSAPSTAATTKATMSVGTTELKTPVPFSAAVSGSTSTPASVFTNVASTESSSTTVSSTPLHQTVQQISTVTTLTTRSSSSNELSLTIAPGDISYTTTTGTQTSTAASTTDTASLHPTVTLPISSTSSSTNSLPSTLFSTSSTIISSSTKFSPSTSLSTSSTITSYSTKSSPSTLSSTSSTISLTSTTTSTNIAQKPPVTEYFTLTMNESHQIKLRVSVDKSVDFNFTLTSGKLLVYASFCDSEIGCLIHSTTNYSTTRILNRTEINSLLHNAFCDLHHKSIKSEASITSTKDDGHVLYTTLVGKDSISRTNGIIVIDQTNEVSQAVASMPSSPGVVIAVIVLVAVAIPIILLVGAHFLLRQFPNRDCRENHILLMGADLLRYFLIRCQKKRC